MINTVYICISPVSPTSFFFLLNCNCCLSKEPHYFDWRWNPKNEINDAFLRYNPLNMPSTSTTSDRTANSSKKPDIESLYLQFANTYFPYKDLLLRPSLVTGEATPSYANGGIPDV